MVNQTKVDDMKYKPHKTNVYLDCTDIHMYMHVCGSLRMYMYHSTTYTYSENPSSTCSYFYTKREFLEYSTHLDPHTCSSLSANIVVTLLSNWSSHWTESLSSTVTVGNN